jgi:hypothetical protein
MIKLKYGLIGGGIFKKKREYSRIRKYLNRVESLFSQEVVRLRVLQPIHTFYANIFKSTHKHAISAPESPA